MAIQDVTPEIIEEENDVMDFGMEVSTEDYDEDYVPRRSTKDAHGEPLTKVKLDDLKVNSKVTGEPDFAIYINDEKEVNGKKFEAKKWDTVNGRLFGDDGEDYLEIYINCPKIDENGFIHNIHQKNNFYNNCFNLIFGFMRHINEDALIDPDSETGYINYFKKINIEKVVEKLNEFTDIEIKVTEGQNGYNGFIITEIWD